MVIKKIALFLILAFAGGITASAQETEQHFQYLGVQGSWWNVEFAGEGFSVEEFSDGFMIAYWYTYDDEGEQMWLIGTGTRVGNTVELEMVRTRNGLFANPISFQHLTEESWGTVTLQINDCGTMDMSYDSLDGKSGGYPIYRLLTKPSASGGSCSAVEYDPPEAPEPPVIDPPEPPTEPPVEPPPAAGITVTMEKRLATGHWVDIDVPFWGLAVIHKTYVGNPSRIELFRLRITVEHGDLTIGSVIASEPTGVSQPSIDGIRPGMTFPQGSQIIFSLESNMTGGQRVYPYYAVHAEGLGQIVDLTVRLSTQTQ
jgi:hypothetical protein